MARSGDGERGHEDDDDADEAEGRIGRGAAADDVKAEESGEAEHRDHGDGDGNVRDERVDDRGDSPERARGAVRHDILRDPPPPMPRLLLGVTGDRRPPP
jgi:hypothetical protein